MDKPIYKQVSFWVALVMTNLGLLLSHGVLGGGDAATAGGWVITILTALGYKKLTEKAPELPPGA